MAPILIILIVGLFTSYCYLIYNIKKYYYESMKSEFRRLTILFASFNISYLLRLAYLLCSAVHIRAIDDHYLRLIMRRLLPLAFDLSSILAILTLHYMSFKKDKEANRTSQLPKAGHFKDESALPKIDDIITNDEQEDGVTLMM